MNDQQLTGALREIGCPYSASDYRARIWLDGFSAAVEQAREKIAREMKAA